MPVLVVDNNFVVISLSVLIFSLFFKARVSRRRTLCKSEGARAALMEAQTGSACNIKAALRGQATARPAVGLGAFHLLGPSYDSAFK